MMHKDKFLLDTLWKRYVVYYAQMFRKMAKTRIWKCVWPLRLGQSWSFSESEQLAKVQEIDKDFAHFYTEKYREYVIVYLQKLNHCGVYFMVDTPKYLYDPSKSWLAHANALKMDKMPCQLGKH